MNVSHDRYFINRTATRILDLTNQSFINYIGNYDYYLEKKEDVEAAHAARTAAASGTSGASEKAAASFRTEGAPSVKQDWKAQKEEQARIRKLQNTLKKTEDEIHALESRDCEIDALLTQEAVYTDVPRLMELNKEKEEISKKLETLYEQWEELAEEM